MDTPHLSDTPHQQEADQQAFFDAVLARARQAEARAGGRVHFLDIAGTTVRLIFAGDGLARHFLPSIAHLEIEPAGDPGMTFHVWDSESTGVEMPPPPFAQDRFTDRGDIWGWNSPRIRSAFHWIECSVNLMDCATNEAVYWVQTARTLPYWTKASPLRTLLHWWTERNGCQLLHAAAVGGQDGAVLITGKGGVGKSTTALACLAAGMDYVGDDYVVVRAAPEPRAYALYNTAKLNPDQVARLEHFRPLITNAPVGADEKAVISLYPARAGQVVRSLPLRAVLTPRIRPQRETTFHPTAKIALQRAAAFTTLSQLPLAGRHTHDYIEDLIGRLPGLEIGLGQAIDDIPDAISGLLAKSDAELVALARLETGPEGAGSAPLVSVIIPVYNGARFLPDAIDNVLRQNYPAVEIIVIDDGSTDDIDAVVAGLPVDVRFFKQKNGGAASARNRGIKDASGDMIAFLDVDDLWPECNLDFLVGTLLRNPVLDLVQGYAQLMAENAVTGKYEYIGNPRESFPHYIGAALYRRRAFEKVGLFDTELQFAEDTDWFNRAREKSASLERLDQVTLLVRRHDANMTRGKSLVELNTLRVFKKALDRRREEQRAEGRR